MITVDPCDTCPAARGRKAMASYCGLRLCLDCLLPAVDVVVALAVETYPTVAKLRAAWPPVLTRNGTVTP